jgi:hypothetical protein
MLTQLFFLVAIKFFFQFRSKFGFLVFHLQISAHQNQGSLSFTFWLCISEGKNASMTTRDSFGILEKELRFLNIF